LLAVLDPDVVLRADKVAVGLGAAGEVRGAPAVAQQALAHRAAFARPAMVNGSMGLVIAPRGRLVMVIGLTIVGDVITELERLSRLELAVLD
jgi:RNA polymerase sigma-70 factor, ECF subfamily